MKDPVLHEPSLMQMLDCVCGVENTSRLQAVAMMSVLDAYDRKITREAFLKMMLSAFALHTQMAKLYMLGEVRESYRGHMDEPDPEIFGTMLRTTQSDVLQLATNLQAQVKAHMVLLVQCPTTQDTVN